MYLHLFNSFSVYTIFKNNKLINPKIESVSERDYPHNNGIDYSFALKVEDYFVNNEHFRCDEHHILSKTEKDKKGNLVKTINLFPLQGRSKITYWNIDGIKIRIDWNYYDLDMKNIDKTNTIDLHGEYLEEKNSDSDRFWISYNFEKDEVNCVSGKCPGNSWELSKTSYSENVYILEYIRKEVK